MISFFDIVPLLFGGLDSNDVEDLKKDMGDAREREDGRRALIVVLTALFGLAMAIVGVVIVFFS
ncbi:hypothetical protein [Arabiibacter massiliensis]|uniref:hypothetical protein n=1 Tax=Arabiibacter massiliensis TaxID=1870985 RepID=UPI0009BB7CA9|nr:hypothetical protein [Arabiibacter massiliensis]